MINELDLERINISAPYLVAPAGLNAFTFATAYGITLSVELIVEETLMNDIESYQFVCDSEGDKQGARARLFRTWFATTELAEQVHREDAKIVEDDGTVNYVTMLIRKDSPYKQAAVAEFREQVELFNKP